MFGILNQYDQLSEKSSNLRANSRQTAHNYMDNLLFFFRQCNIAWQKRKKYQQAMTQWNAKNIMMSPFNSSYLYTEKFYLSWARSHTHSLFYQRKILLAKIRLSGKVLSKLFILLSAVSSISNRHINSCSWGKDLSNFEFQDYI